VRVIVKHPLIDPIAHAWKCLQRVPLPAPLVLTEIQRAGHANGALGKKGKGKHLMAVCA
jgi:hypothetical protein